MRYFIHTGTTNGMAELLLYLIFLRQSEQRIVPMRKSCFKGPGIHGVNLVSWMIFIIWRSG